MIYTFAEAAKKFGSSYQIEREIEKGNLFKHARGFYSPEKWVNQYALLTKRYPEAVITMDSAFYIHNLADRPPTRTHLATRRGASRIPDKTIKQYFLADRLLEPGKIKVEYDQAEINIYSRERMLIELVRNSASMPLDYYKEIILNYRDIAHKLDFRSIEEYMDLFERNDYMFKIIQREVL